MKKTLTNPHYITLLKNYTSFITVKNYKIGKSNNYQSAVSEFLMWLEVVGITKIKDVTSKISITYFEFLITRSKVRGIGTLADKTIKFHLFAIGLFQLNLLENNELKNAFYLPPYNHSNQNLRNVLTIDDVKAIYKHCQNLQEKALMSVA